MLKRHTGVNQSKNIIMKSTHQLKAISVPIGAVENTSNIFNRGLLTSSYKQEIRQNYRNLKSTSLYSLKQTVKTNHHQFMPAAGTILKIAVFVIAYLVAFL
ncbi:hypothetical protein KAOT1_21702 [Kordia algicida OT-1]|uniref:Uncharacterized protein n=2 Tax=Kordia TaxID=221065 RepID=A9DMZ3_9FLAO|nr:hypothetical protein KAOT1_21702 [Kordia algicida OT-1]